MGTNVANTKIKILWIYKYSASYNFDKWFHLEYARWLASHPSIELVAYGPDIQVEYNDIAPIAYSSDKTMEEIHKQFNFDVVILNTKSRMFDYYSPNTKTAKGCILPPDFNSFVIPKVMIEEDYHYETDNEWYKDVGIDLILQRHYNSFLRGMKNGLVETRWFPFSVDTNIFKPSTSTRINQIALVGTAIRHVYPHRDNIKNILKPINLIEDFGGKRQYNEQYIQTLQSYSAHLCCSSVYNITPAKMFEIMACGSILFTNENNRYGLEYLFSNNSYVTYKEDYSDIVSKAKYLLDNDLHYVRRDARNTIINNHSNEKRTEELLTILKNKFNISPTRS